MICDGVHGERVTNQWANFLRNRWNRIAFNQSQYVEVLVDCILHFTKRFHHNHTQHILWHHDHHKLLLSVLKSSSKKYDAGIAQH